MLNNHKMTIILFVIRIIYSPKLQHHWNLNIRLFSVIFRTLSGGSGLIPLQRGSQCILRLQTN